MQDAADIALLDEVRKLFRARKRDFSAALAQLGRDVLQAERLVDFLLA